MNVFKVHETVKKEFDSIIASMVVVALTINLSTKIKDKDFDIPGRFTNRINKKTREVLHSHNQEDVELVIKIRDAWNEFESRHTLEGLGGCEVKTLKSIIGFKE